MSKSIIIIGCQGSGKALIANALAKKFGPYSVMSGRDFLSINQFMPFAKSSRTVVVDEISLNPHTLQCIKQIVTPKWYQYHERGKSPVSIPTPRFIFTMNSTHVVSDMRKFNKIRYITVITSGGTL